MRNYITEFIGTFFLVLVVLLTGQAFMIGAMLMVMVYAGGHISGAHYNPAVTLAVWLRGKITIAEAFFYMLVQVIGGGLAAFLVQWLNKDSMNIDQVTMNLDGKYIQALIAEVLGTFALAYVVLNVATTKGTAGNSFYGLAIGFTVFACASALGKFSGGAFNPAVAIGLSIADLFEWKNIWIYLVGCFGAAAMAAIAFNFLNREDTRVPPIAKEPS